MADPAARVPPRVKNRGKKEYAGMVELVDSVDLGSSVLDVQVRVLLPAPNKKERLLPLFFV